MSEQTPVEVAAEALEPAMKGVWLLEDHEVAPTYARAVFETIDVEALGRMLCYRGGSVNGPQPVGLVCGPHLEEAEAVVAWLTGGAR